MENLMYDGVRVTGVDGLRPNPHLKRVRIMPGVRHRLGPGVGGGLWFAWRGDLDVDVSEGGRQRASSSVSC